MNANDASKGNYMSDILLSVSKSWIKIFPKNLCLTVVLSRINCPDRLYRNV